MLPQFVFFLQCALLPLRCRAVGATKYQAVVFPELLDERSDEGTRVLKLNDDITLKLKPSSLLPEDFFLRTYRQGVAQYRYYDVKALQQDLYHDERALAAVHLSDEDGVLEVEGVVGPNLKIRPIEGAERGGDGRQAHLIETIDNTGNVYGKYFDDQSVDVSSRDGFDPSAYSIQKIHPEVLVSCDTTFRAGFKSDNHMMRYLLIVFQVVNIRYKTVTQPKVHIVFRGVELTKAEVEVTYYTYLTAAKIDGYKSLQAIVKYVEKNNATYEEFDMLYFLTGLNMVQQQGSIEVESLAGFAFVASACTSHRQQLGEDTAYTYRGIRIMTHEMAHTLGCPHDGTTIDGIVKAFKPDSQQCPWHLGYIMSYEENDHRSMKFSSCCSYQIAQMTWSIGAACLRRNDSTRSLAKRKRRPYLPGEILNKDKQCKLTYPDLVETYFMPEHGIQYCKAECFVPGYQFRAADSHWSMLLIDGTPCDNTGKRCINGDCVAVKGEYRTPKEKSRPPRTTTAGYYD